MDTYVCSACHETKPIACFYRDRSQSNGHTSRCRSCLQAIKKSRRLANLAHHRAYGRAYFHRTREKAHARSQRYHAEHADAICARKRAQRLNDPQHVRAIALAARQRNPEESAAKVMRYYVRRNHGTGNDVTAEQWKEIKAAFDYRCAYCGRKMRALTMDHIIPLSKGGLHTASNIVPACKSCNSKKGERSPLVPVQPFLLTLASSKTKKD